MEEKTEFEYEKYQDILKIEKRKESLRELEEDLEKMRRKK